MIPVINTATNALLFLTLISSASLSAVNRLKVEQTDTVFSKVVASQDKQIQMMEVAKERKGNANAFSMPI